MTRPAYTPDQKKASSVGKLDQICADCGKGSAISTDRCVWCGCEDIEYRTHQQQGLDDPALTQYLCGANRPDPSTSAARRALRWPRRESV